MQIIISSFHFALNSIKWNCFSFFKFLFHFLFSRLFKFSFKQIFFCFRLEENSCILGFTQQDILLSKKSELLSKSLSIRNSFYATHPLIKCLRTIPCWYVIKNQIWKYTSLHCLKLKIVLLFFFFCL